MISKEESAAGRERETEILFRYGKNERLTIITKGVDGHGRLWARGIFKDKDDQQVGVAGFLASINNQESQEQIGVMIYGWALTEINGQRLSEMKYLLADVAEIKLEVRRRILSKAAYEQEMRNLALKRGIANLTRVPELKIFSLKNN